MQQERYRFYMPKVKRKQPIKYSAEELAELKKMNEAITEGFEKAKEKFVVKKDK